MVGEATAVEALDEGDELLHLRRIGMIHADGNAAAAGGGDQLGGLFDGFGAARIDAVLAGAAASAVDGGAGLAQRNGNAAAAGGGDQLGGLFDGFGAARTDAVLAGAAASAVDGGAGFAQRNGDAAARAARCSGDESDLSSKRLLSRFLWHGAAIPAGAHGSSWRCGTAVVGTRGACKECRSGKKTSGEDLSEKRYVEFMRVEQRRNAERSV